MYAVTLIVLYLAATASAISHFYHNAVVERNLSYTSAVSELLPVITFRNLFSPLLHQDNITFEFGLKNIPWLLLNDGRVYVSLWLCEFIHDRYCSEDGEFQMVWNTKLTVRSNGSEEQFADFTSRSYSLAVSEGQYRLRLVLEFIDPEYPLDLKPSSGIEQFMDEITVTRRAFVMPTVDVWWNDNVPDVDPVAKSYFELVQKAVGNAFLNSSRLTETELALHGMSGVQFRHFYNNLGTLIPEVHYLEIGIFAGSTMVSLLAGNTDNVKSVFGMDYWHESDVLGNRVGGMTTVKQMFLDVIPRYTNSELQKINIMQADCWSISPKTLLETTRGQKFNVYMFDGPHSAADHFFAVVNYFPALADVFILLVDDWNWERVRVGTESGLVALKHQVVVLGKVELFTGEHAAEGQQDHLWHNGMAVYVIQKKNRLSSSSSSIGLSGQ